LTSRLNRSALPLFPSIECLRSAAKGLRFTQRNSFDLIDFTEPVSGSSKRVEQLS